MTKKEFLKMNKLSEEHRHFNKAYKHHFGKEWNWKKSDGTQRCVMIDGNPIDQAFYAGFILAKKGQDFYKSKLKDIENLKRAIEQIEKSIL